MPTKKITTFIKPHAQVITAFAAFIIAYVPVFSWMKIRWFARDSYYSHGILIPFVSLFLLWQMRDELSAVEKKSSPHGLTLVILGAVLYVGFAAFRVSFAAGFTMLIVLAGIILHFWGVKVFKKIAFPFFFLLFMIPLPQVVIINLSFRMKMLAAQISTNILNMIHIPAVRFGSIIKMHKSQVVVDDVCSGLRSLVSLLALGSIFSFWIKGAFWKRLVLFLSSVPIAIITNMCRVIFLSVVSEIWGSQYIHGFVHDASGFMIFGVAFLLLVWVKNLLD